LLRADGVAEVIVVLLPLTVAVTKIHTLIWLEMCRAGAGAIAPTQGEQNIMKACCELEWIYVN
jgi:hypothetical protein